MLKSPCINCPISKMPKPSCCFTQLRNALEDLRLNLLLLPTEKRIPNFTCPYKEIRDGMDKR